MAYVEWTPSGYTYGYHMSWEDFGQLMKDKGTQ